MLPGMGGVDPKQMAKMMKQMGIENTNVPAKRVIIEQEGGKIIIDEPQILKISFSGQDSYQISGNARQEGAGIRDEDVKLVAESANVGENEARKALEEANGDIAEAILKLQKPE